MKRIGAALRVTLLFFLCVGCEKQPEQQQSESSQPLIQDSLSVLATDTAISSPPEDSSLYSTFPDEQCWEKGIKNSYECAKRMESDALSRWPDRAQRADSLLSITLDSGDTLRISESDIEDWGETESFFFDYIPDINFYLLRILVNEGGWYELIHARTGKKWRLNGIPLVSPDKRRFAVTQHDLAAGYSPNELSVFRFEDDQLFKEFGISAEFWGAGRARWVGNDAVEVEIHRLVDDPHAHKIEKHWDYLFRNDTTWILKNADASPVFLGVVSPVLIHDGCGGLPLVGTFQDSGFHPVQYDEGWKSWQHFVSTFPVGIPFQGINPDGCTNQFTVTERTDPAGLYEPLFLCAEASANSCAGKKPFLLASQDSLFTFVASRECDVTDSAFTSTLRGRIDGLYEIALKSREKDEVFARHDVRNPFALRIQVDTEEFFAVTFPLVLESVPYDKDYRDTRAKVFFLYEAGKDTVTYSTFGHPEWSPQSENVNSVEPLAFLKIKDYENPVMFCEYSGGWESMGYALIDMRTGKVLLQG